MSSNVSEVGPVRVFSLDEGEAFSPLEGIGMRAVFGKGASLNLVTLGPGTELALHSHPHEQIGIVIEGVEILIVDGQEYPLGPMQAYVVPGGVEHGGIGGPEGCVVLDVFVPAREEYRDAAAAGRDIAEPPEGE
jgi:unsaturated pyranuronate lyase